MSNKKSKHNSNQANQSVIVFILLSALVLVGFIALMATSVSNPSQSSASSNTVSMVGDKQIVEVIARAGYTPSSINAKANTATTLRMKSEGAFGCERSLYITSLGISKNLPTNGDTDIDLGIQKPGTKINASCSMGMYRFVINFT